MTRRGPAYGPGDATRQSPGTHAQLTLLEGLPVNLVTIAGQDADGCIEVYGMHVVVVLWCSTDGSSRIPVAFRLWRPKRSCTPGAYQTKLQLAAQMLTELVAARLPFQNLVTDTHYTAGWFPRLAGRLGIYWVGTLPPKTTVIWRGRPQSAAELAERLRLAWRPRLGLRATAVTVYAPTYGPLRLVVTRNRHGNLEPVVTSDLGADLNRVVERKHSRWSVETLFRDIKQYTGLGACQCYSDAAMVRHVGLVLLGFVVLQQLRTRPGESLAAVKQRWQLTLTHQGQPPPAPLKACPAHLRPTTTAQVLLPTFALIREGVRRSTGAESGIWEGDTPAGGRR